MLEGFFPERLDNDYSGHPLALWVFYPITLLTIGRSCVHILASDGGAQSIATIPLDSMSPEAVSGIVFIFSVWGLSQLLFACIYVVSLWRYRTLLPLLYLLLIVEYAGRFLLGTWKPLITIETPPGATANVAFMALGSVMLLLSLRSTTERDPAA